jgi:hypothetical protein
MNKLKSILAKIASYFASGEASQDFEQVARLVPVAMPYVAIVADLVVAVTPTKVDDAAVACLRAYYPDVVDGSIVTKSLDDRKALAARVAGDLLKNKYPEVSTSIARAAVQLAYVGRKADSR